MKSTDKHLEAQRRWREKHPDYHRAWRKANRDTWNQYKAKWRRQLRMEVLEYYGGTPPQCACCGEHHKEFLSVDHINGGGVRDRQIHRSGNAVYQWLRARGYPLGFRVLCHNCNAAIGHYGYCPHQIKEIPKEGKDEKMDT